MSLSWRVGALVYFSSLMVIIQVVGHGLGKWILPTRWKNDLPFFAPVLGYAFLSLAMGYLSYVGVSAHTANLFLPVLLGGAALFSWRRSDLQLYDSFFVKVWVVGLGGGLLVLLPSLVYNGMYPYTDAFTYVSIADYLRTHGFFERMGFDFYHPTLTQVALYQNGFRMATQFFLGFSAALFRVPFSLEMYLPVVAIGHSLFILAMGLFCRRALELPEIPTLGAVVLAATNFSLLLKNASLGFLPQAYGMAVFLFAITWLFSRLTGSFEKKEYLLGGLLSAMMVFTYSELVPFWALAAVLFLVHRQASAKDGIRWLVRLIVTAVICALINPVALKGMMSILPTQMRAVVGWNVPLSAWEVLASFFSFHRLEGPHNSVGVWHGHVWLYALAQGVSVAAIILLITGYLRRQGTEGGRVRWSPVLWAVVPAVAVCLWMAWFKINPFDSVRIGQSWSVFKCIQYLYFIVPPLIAYGLWRNRFVSQIHQVSGYGVAGVMVAAGLFLALKHARTQVKIVANTVDRSDNPLQAYYDLRECLDPQVPGVRLAIPGEFQKHRQMVAYILKDRLVSADWKDDGYICNTLPPRDARHDESSWPMLAMDRPEQGRPVGARLTLLQPHEVGFQWEFKSGWYDAEQDDSGIWRWSTGVGELSFPSPLPTNEKIILEFICLWADPASMKGHALVIEENGIPLTRIKPSHPGWNEIRAVISLKEPADSLTFRYTGSSVKLKGDPRNLGFAIKNLKIKAFPKTSIQGKEGVRVLS